MDLYRYYKNPEWYQLEQEHIFEKYWLFAGLSISLTEPSHFLRRRILGRDLIFRRDPSGRLTCRFNRCGHRGGPFVLQNFGQRANVCQYHCWRYDERGCLVNIPNVDKFDSQGELPNSKLAVIHVMEIGAFIFVHFGEEPNTFEAQYGADVAPILKTISTTFDKKYSYTQFNCQYNWKLNFENVIDANHLAFVHPQTFGRIAGKLTSPEDPVEDSLWFAQGTGTLRNLAFFHGKTYDQDDVRSLSQLSRQDLRHVERWYEPDMRAVEDKGGHLALQLFPNCNIGSIHGEMYYMQFFEPVSPDLTTFHSWVVASRLDMSFAGRLPSLLWGMHHSEKKVIDEDRVILEATHAAVSPGMEQALGKFDQKVEQFRSWLHAHVYTDDSSPD